MVKNAKPKHRSPNAPVLPLDEALERARKIYEREKRHPASLQAISSAWGMSAKSSGAKQGVATLRRFELLLDADADGGRVSDAAVKLLLGDPESAEWRATARTVALAPDVHMTMWRKYGGILPSDASVRAFLVADLGFSQESAPDFLAQYKRTIAFARLDDAELKADGGVIPITVSATGRLTTAEPNQEAAMSEQSVLATAPRPVSPPTPVAARTGRPVGVDELRLPLFQGAAILSVQFARPLTKEEWANMVKALEALGHVNAIVPERRVPEVSAAAE